MGWLYVQHCSKSTSYACCTPRHGAIFLGCGVFVFCVEKAWSDWGSPGLCSGPTSTCQHSEEKEIPLQANAVWRWTLRPVVLAASCLLVGDTTLHRTQPRAWAAFGNQPQRKHTGVWSHSCPAPSLWAPTNESGHGAGRNRPHGARGVPTANTEGLVHSLWTTPTPPPPPPSSLMTSR